MQKCAIGAGPNKLLAMQFAIPMHERRHRAPNRARKIVTFPDSFSHRRAFKFILDAPPYAPADEAFYLYLR